MALYGNGRGSAIFKGLSVRQAVSPMDPLTRVESRETTKKKGNEGTEHLTATIPSLEEFLVVPDSEGFMELESKNGVDDLGILHKLPSCIILHPKHFFIFQGMRSHPQTEREPTC